MIPIRRLEGANYQCFSCQENGEFLVVFTETTYCKKCLRSWSKTIRALLEEF